MTRGALVFALGLLASSCGPEPVDLDLRGRVSDAATGQPVARVPVNLIWSGSAFDVRSIGTESGPDGRYLLHISDFECDAPSLYAGVAPYELQSKDVRCTDEAQVIDFELAR